MKVVVYDLSSLGQNQVLISAFVSPKNVIMKLFKILLQNAIIFYRKICILFVEVEKLVHFLIEDSEIEDFGRILSLKIENSEIVIVFGLGWVPLVRRCSSFLSF